MRGLAGEKTLLKRLNRAAILRLVWEQPGISRSVVAQEIGITKSTVSQLVAELESERWLSSGAGGAGNTPGRPSIPLSLNADQLALIGVELGLESVNAVAVDPFGRVLAQCNVKGRHERVAVALEQLAEVLKTLRSNRSLQGRTLLGMGVGVPGPVDVGRGLLLHAPNQGWKNVPIQRMILAQIPDIPRVFVDNDANLAAFAEYMFGAHKHSADLLYLYLNDGIGGGLILEHGLYRGRLGFAGEVGHMNVLPDGAHCSCGSRGCAETLLSWRSVQATTKRLTGTEMGVLEILEALRNGHQQLRLAIEQTGTYLGIFLGSLANIFDPKLLIVGGPIAELGDAILEPALLEMNRRMFGNEFRSVTVERCAFSNNACAIGAAGYAFHDLLQNKTDDLPQLE